VSERHDREEEARRQFGEQRRATNPHKDWTPTSDEPRRTADPSAEHAHDPEEVDRGTSWISVLIGMLAALGAALLLSGIVGSIVTIVIALLASADAEAGGGISGIVGVLVTAFLAYLIGGYAAGRMVSRKGTKHGLLSALLGVVTALLLMIGTIVGVGISDNLAGVVLPNVPANSEQHDLGSLLAFSAISGVLILLFPFAGGAIGGGWGARTGRRRP
jgi:MFS family permease